MIETWCEYLMFEFLYGGLDADKIDDYIEEEDESQISSSEE